MGFLICLADEAVRDQWSGELRSLPLDERKGLCIGGGAWAFEFWQEGREPIAVWRERDQDDKSSIVVVCGWCYSVDGSSDTLYEGDYREVLDRHREGLPPLATRYSGHFIAVVYDDVTRRIAVQPDRWAIRATYYSVTPSGAILVSDRASVIGERVGSTIDGYSLISLMRGTHAPFGRTLFTDVHRVTPGCYLTIDLRAVRLRLERSTPLYLPLRSIGFTEAVEEMSSKMRRVAARLSATKGALFDLTGGHDTRLVAAGVAAISVSNANDDILWKVVGEKSDPDVRIAREITAAESWSLLTLEPVALTDALFDELKHAAVAADATCSVDQAFGRLRQESAIPQRMGRLIGAIGGELLRGFFWRHEMFRLGRSTRVDYKSLLDYRLYAGRDVDLGLMSGRPISFEDHDDELLRGYRLLGDAGGDRLNSYKLDVMYLHKLSYSAGGSASWLIPIRDVRLPFLSAELADLAVSIPWKLRANRQLVLAVIRRLSPRFGLIPNDKNEPMEPIGLLTMSAYCRAGVRRSVAGVGRVVRRWVGRQQRRTERRQEVPPSTWRSLLESAEDVAPICDQQSLEALCRRVASAPLEYGDATAFYSLLTVEVLFRAFPNLSRRLGFGKPPAIPA